MNDNLSRKFNTSHDFDFIRLARCSTPTICNALESLGFDPGAGFSDASLRLLTEELPPFVGRAVTAKLETATRLDPGDEPNVPTEEYWSYVAAEPGPKVLVAQDIDPNPVGAMWGEVQGRLHRSLGVVGIVTNGAVRDIDELKRIPLPVIAGRTCVSHAYARFVEINVPVVVGGLEVLPGDIVHADRHGVQLIPAGTPLTELSNVAQQIDLLEAELFAAANHNQSGLDEFLVTWQSVQSRWPRAATPLDARHGAPATASHPVP